LIHENDDLRPNGHSYSFVILWGEVEVSIFGIIRRVDVRRIRMEVAEGLDLLTVAALLDGSGGGS
jgi:hypothetical protein